MNRNQKFTLALVTGASSGIGEAIAKLLAEQGINLIIHGRNVENLQRLQQYLAPKVSVDMLIADLAKPLERQKLIEIIRSRQPDLVINNAGFGLYGPAASYAVKQQMEILDVNGHAVLELTLETVANWITACRKGVILNVSSSAGELPLAPGFAVYSASKAFVNHVSQSLDREVCSKGIRVLAAAPGFVETNFGKRAGSKRIPEMDKVTMSADFAAEQIWMQINKEIPLHVFNWKTKLMITLSNLLPKQWMAPIIQKFNQERTL